MRFKLFFNLWIFNRLFSVEGASWGKAEHEEGYGGNHQKNRNGLEKGFTIRLAIPPLSGSVMKQALALP